MEVICQHLDAGTYADTIHVQERKNQRGISILEIEEVLRGGYWEKRKDTFDEYHQAWNYAVRGKTNLERELRIIVSFDDALGLLLITAIDLSLDF